MIQFRPLTLADRELYNQFVKDKSPRGCEMSFANLFLWGNQQVAVIDDNMMFLSTFSKSFYLFPYCNGDVKKAIDGIIQDAKERNIPCMITAVCQNEKEILERLYPDRFEFTTNEGSYDYVYNIDDLADLKGRKYHKKRNHLYHFQKAHPDYMVEPINAENLTGVKALVDSWYQLKDDGTGAFDYEKQVFDKAMTNYQGLGLIGIVLKAEGQVVAVTFASPFTSDTLDVHFEKAIAEVDGAYTAINYEFARYVRRNYPHIKYLDREEDMGIEGLRKAKRSYYPAYQVVKYRATLKTDL